MVGQSALLSVMRRLIIFLMILAAFPGCTGARASSPLAILGRLDSAEVTVRGAMGGTPSHSTVVRDSVTLAHLRMIASEPGDWHPNEGGTPPAGDLRAALYRGTVYVGVISAGRNWVGARDAEGNARFRTMTGVDSLRIAQIRALK